MGVLERYPVGSLEKKDLDLPAFQTIVICARIFGYINGYILVYSHLLLFIDCTTKIYSQIPRY